MQRDILNGWTEQTANMGGGSSEKRGRRLGYLLSQYPAVSHTFLLHEIRALRRLGFDIVAVSVQKADRPPESMSSEEAEEFALTFSILGAGVRNALAAHLRTLVGRPAAYLRTLWYAVRLSGGNIRQIPSHCLWFAEAVVAGDYLRRRGVDHLHTHFSSTVALLLSNVFGIGFSATIHGSAEFDDVGAFHMADKVERATFIATISRYGSSQTMRASDPSCWRKIHCLPLGVDLSNFTPQPRSAPADRFNILCVGRLAPAKALHVLIDAVVRLAAQGRNVRLTLVGDGPLRTTLERAVVDAGIVELVTFAGACNHDRVVEFLRESDVFALTSFAEGVPVVLMEAMAMRIPCVATWITGIPELIRPDVDGLLVPPTDSEAVAAAIARLMDDPGLRLRLGASARERVASCYELTTNVQRLAERFRTELGSSIAMPSACSARAGGA